MFDPLMFAVLNFVFDLIEPVYMSPANYEIVDAITCYVTHEDRNTGALHQRKAGMPLPLGSEGIFRRLEPTAGQNYVHSPVSRDITATKSVPLGLGPE